jgi:hypothetical protein
MIALRVKLNGTLFCVAGANDLSVLNTIVNAADAPVKLKPKYLHAYVPPAPKQTYKAREETYQKRIDEALA